MSQPTAEKRTGLLAGRRGLCQEVWSLDTRSAPYESHREAVCAVLRGEADAALTTAAWAGHVGLRFLELAEEPYDVVLFAEHLGVAQVVGLCEVAQTQAFRAALSRIAGYDARKAGEILYLSRPSSTGRV